MKLIDMKIFRIVLLTTLSICLISCGNNEKNSKDKQLKIIDVSGIGDADSDVASFIKNTSYTLLETNEHSMLNTVKKVSWYKDAVYISDFSKKQIFIFDRKGRYMSKLDASGKGPGQYLAINDFTIDKGNNYLSVLSAQQNSIFLYDINTLQFVKSIQLNTELIPSSFEWVSGDSYVFSRNHICFNDTFNNHNFFMIDGEGNVVSEIAKFPPVLRNVLYNSNPFSLASKKLYFSNPSERSVYVLGEDSTTKAHYSFDFGGQNIDFNRNDASEIPKEDLQSMISKMTSLNKVLEENPGVFGPVSFYETNSHMVFECITQGQNVLVFYCKKSRKIKVLEPIDVLVLGLPATYVTIVGVSPDAKSLICEVYPYRIKELCQSLDGIEASNNPITSNIEKLRELNSKINEDSNPVFIQFEVTEF